MQLTRHNLNPILAPKPSHEWESFAAFNGSVLKKNDDYHLIYRAISDHRRLEGKELRMSSIGHSTSKDGINFEETEILIKPERPWDRFGCEDPRATYLEGKTYLFYTAIGAYPFVSDHIRVGLAIFKNMNEKPEFHLVTPFNAKAMALFPEKINGKYAVILSANTDLPPATVGIAMLDSIEQLWSREFWNKWYLDLPKHALHLRRLNTDQVEVGAVPLRVKEGWLLIYCRIQNYGHPGTTFGIEAALLDAEDPRKILARNRYPLLVPKENYEMNGTVSNVVFPSGASIVGEELRVYYGGADTVCALATCHLQTLLKSLTPEVVKVPFLTRSPANPILTSRWDHPWERLGVYNPGVLQDDDKLEVVYRGQDNTGTSFMGLATFSAETTKFLSRESEPIYWPREFFEEKAFPQGHSGCEDPRLTLIGDRVYMHYTAYRGDSPPRVALTSILLEEFRARKWDSWTKPILISPPGIADKDACLFPEKIRGNYVTIHRIEPDIVLDYRPELDFDGTSKWLESQTVIPPRKDSWEGLKIGANAPPIKTPEGWLLFYHGVGSHDRHYRLGALLLDLQEPSHIIGRTLDPILEPEEPYERFGQVRNVVFPCGVGLWGDTLHIFYGGADTCTCLASGSLSNLLRYLKSCGDIR
ncbi:MAG: hypothetical protein ACM3MG_08710 [Bacillota bacterium]